MDDEKGKPLKIALLEAENNYLTHQLAVAANAAAAVPAAAAAAAAAPAGAAPAVVAAAVGVVAAAPVGAVVPFLAAHAAAGGGAAAHGQAAPAAPLLLWGADITAAALCAAVLAKLGIAELSRNTTVNLLVGGPGVAVDKPLLVGTLIFPQQLLHPSWCNGDHYYFPGIKGVGQADKQAGPSLNAAVVPLRAYMSKLVGAKDWLAPLLAATATRADALANMYVEVTEGRHGEKTKFQLGSLVA